MKGKMEWKIYFLIVNFLIQGGMCLHITSLRVPSHAVRNQSARLECDFHLDNEEELYSVKWYKDGSEFFRYVPRDLPPAQVFPLPGVSVDIHNSTKNVVVLSSVQLSSTGSYKCEVSGEAPFFNTVNDRQHMMVVALPEEGPRITGGRPRYQVGDTVRVNCTSGRSKPAAQLNWMINGEPVDSKFLRGPYILTTGREGLETSILGLQFTVRHRHFKHGNMKLKCLATIATLYLVSNEESVEGERTLRASVLESRGTAAPSGSRADRVQAAGGRQPFLWNVYYLVGVCYLLLLASPSDTHNRCGWKTAATNCAAHLDSVNDKQRAQRYVRLRAMCVAALTGKNCCI